MDVPKRRVEGQDPFPAEGVHLRDATDSASRTWRFKYRWWITVRSSDIGPNRAIWTVHVYPGIPQILTRWLGARSQNGPGSQRSYRSARRALAAAYFYSRRSQQPEHPRQGRPGRRYRGLGDCRLVPVILGVYHCLSGKSAKLVLDKGDRPLSGLISGRT